MKVKELLEKLSQSLSNNELLKKRGWTQLEAEQIALHVLHLTKAELLSRLNTDVSPSEQGEALRFAEKRAGGYPLQYLTKKQQFLDHEYRVEEGVLIPRPETEILVLECLKWLETQKGKKLKGIEVGLGSGCISIELLSKVKTLEMVGTEVLEESLDISDLNAKEILEDSSRLKKIWVSESDPINPDKEPFDFLISNPPYVDPSDEIDPDVEQHEPEEALYPPEGPNYFYEKFCEESEKIIQPHGKLFLEIPHQRADEIKSIFENKGMKTNIVDDLTGKPRVLIVGKQNG